MLKVFINSRFQHDSICSEKKIAKLFLSDYCHGDDADEINIVFVIVKYFTYS